MMIRNVYMMNLNSLDALPRWERWYWRHHAPEAVEAMGPWLRRYQSWRAIPEREDFSPLGHYNYRWTELWFNDFEIMDRPLVLTWWDRQDVESDTPLEDPYHGGWSGSMDGPHPIAQSWVPAIPQIRIDNHPSATEEPAAFRWTGLIRFPTGGEAADRWFTDHVLAGLARTEGVLRIRSSRTLHVPEDILRNLSSREPQQFIWERFVEIDVTRLSIFRAAALSLLEWDPDKRRLAHGVEPYRDLISIVTLERPDWRLHDIVPKG
ncbi:MULTISPECIES: hypothetical protein [Sphingobium]|uniref:hypothetical protein n=1 Tax=Sphingobium TaxID=165695 RepID=UPI00159CA38C|nr:hypothetical protein [Sphingobium sp. 15-1]